MLQGFELQIQKTLFSVTIKNDWVLFKKPKKPFMKKPILAILGINAEDSCQLLVLVVLETTKPTTNTYTVDIQRTI
jgi:hypothetical protein